MRPGFLVDASLIHHPERLVGNTARDRAGEGQALGAELGDVEVAVAGSSTRSSGSLKLVRPSMPVTDSVIVPSARGGQDDDVVAAGVAGDEHACP